MSKGGKNTHWEGGSLFVNDVGKTARPCTKDEKWTSSLHHTHKINWKWFKTLCTM